MTQAFNIVLDLDEEEYTQRASEVPDGIHTALENAGYAVESVNLVPTLLPQPGAAPLQPPIQQT